MIIFLISGKAESGKDTFHQLSESYLRPKYNVTRLAFADEVKHVAFKMGWNGMKDENGRSGLIMVGDGARKYFDPHIWIKKLIRKLETVDYCSPNENRDIWHDDIIFITDCRYPNEIDMLKEWAKKYEIEAYAVRVNRPGHVNKLTSEQRENLSETALDDYNRWDIVIENNGTMEEFADKVRFAVRNIVERGNY